MTVVREERIFHLEIKTAPKDETRLSVLCQRYVGAQLFESLQSAGPECWRDERWQHAKRHLHSQVSEDVLRSLNAFLLETAAASTTYDGSKVARQWSRKAFQVWWLFLKSNDKRTLLPLWPYSYQTPSPWEHPFPYWPKSLFSDDLALFLAEAEEAKGVQLESVTLRITTSAHNLSRALKSQTNLKHLRLLLPTARRGADAVATLASSFSSPVLQSLTVCHGYPCGQNFYAHGNAPHLGQFILPCVQAHSNTLTSLELPIFGSSLCNVHAVQFGKALNACTKLQTLSTSGECMSHFSPLLCPIRNLHLIWAKSNCHIYTSNHDYALDLSNILRVCPNVTSLVLVDVCINDKGLAQLDKLKHCLTKITCHYMGVGLLDLLQCCPIAREVQILSRNEDLIANVREDPCIALPFLQKFKLRHGFHQSELMCILKRCPDLRELSLRGHEMFGFNQTELINLIRGEGVLKRLETFHMLVIERYNRMTMPLLLEVMKLPAIQIVDNALWCKLNNEGDKEQVLTLAREKGMDVVEASLCLEKRRWLGEDGSKLFDYYDYE